MSNNIALTASMRSNLLSLQNTQKLMNGTQDHLSSGYKVNSAMDNPSSYFTAQALNSRANDLSTLLDSIGQAISTLEVADQGITSLQDFVEQAKAVANSARDTANVQANVSSKIKFDNDALRSKKVVDQVNGLRPGSSDMTIRLGDATKLEGTTNVNEQTALSKLGIATSEDAHDIGTISVGEKDYMIDASGTTKQMTSVQSYGEKSVLKINDISDITKAKVEDAAGNEFVVDLSGITDMAADAKQITVKDGKEGGLEATVSEDGKTTWKLSDKTAWKAVAEHTTTTEYEAGKKFKILNREATGTDHQYKVTFGDKEGHSLGQITVTDEDLDTLDNDTIAFDKALTVTEVDNEVQIDKSAFASDPTATVSDADADAADITKADPDTDTITGRPLKDLTGEARDIKGTFTYGIKDGESVVFKLSDVDLDAKTGTLTDKDGNVFKNVDLTGVKKADGSGPMDDAESTEITITADGADISISFSAANNGIVTSMKAENEDGDAVTWQSLGRASKTDADADAQGTMVGANTIYIDNSGSVQDMAEVMQTMIGNTTIKVSVEDSSLQIQTLDTSSVAVKDGKILGTNGTANGVGFASAFGLDQGKTVTLEKSDTAESLRQKIDKLDGVTAEFDKDGRLVVKSEQGDDMVISGELADKLGVTGAATNGNNERAAYSKQFNALLGQIDDLVKDTSYKGINLLNGDNLTVNFNENRTSSLELKGVKFDSVGLGFTQADNEWISNESIDKSLSQIMKATSMLRTQASEFGQNLSTVQIREDFTQNMINNLQAGADKLTLADMNEEGANMLALQTRQQLGTSSLSLASQASQSVLRLF